MGKIVIPCLALVVGVALGFSLALLAEPLAPAPRPASVPVPGPTAADSRPAPVPATVEVAPAVEVAPVSSTSLATLPGDDLLAAVLESLRAPDPMRGEGTIKVHVATEEGAPVAGVSVRATPSRPAAPGVAPRRSTDAPQTPEQRLRGYVKNLQHERDSTARGTTDAAGICLLAGLAPVDHRVSLQAPGYELERRTHSRVTPDAELEVKAVPLVLQQVDVRLPDGTRPEQAHVSTAYERRNTGFSWTPAHPEFEMRAGQDVELIATVKGDDEFKSESVTVSAAAGSIPEVVVLQLEGRAGIRGSVDGLPAEGSFEVQAILHSGSEPPRPDFFRRSEHSDHIFPGREPEFAFLDIAPGSYYVRLLQGREIEVGSARVEVTDGIASCTLRYEAGEWAREEYALVWVRTPDGELAEASFSMRMLSGSGSHGGSERVERLEDGSYRVGFLVVDEEWGLTGEVEYRLQVRVSGHGEKEVSFTRTATTVIEVQMEEPATLQVAVPGLAGSGREDQVKLSLYQVDGGSRTGMGKLKRLGPELYESVAIAPQELTLQVVLRSGRRSRFDEPVIAARVVQLRSGLNHVQVPMPPLHQVELIAQELDPGTRVHARHQEINDDYDNQGTSTVDAEHRAVFESLPPGPYLLRAGRREMYVVIGGPTTLLWQPDELNALRVRCRDSGYLADLGFRRDDHIIGLDGEVLPSASEIQAAIVQAGGAGETATLTVQRGAARLTIAVDALRFATRDQLGGSYSPATLRNR